ncbi:MAG TPA: hypothetical protein VGJ84_03360, partial [Polyangiaceae bacterium]
TVKLGIDLDRNGKLSNFEVATGQTDGAGVYTLRYTLDPTKVDLQFVAFATQVVTDYQARGFDALLDMGPLPAVLTFEREGYTTVVRRLSTMQDRPALDVVLAPLQQVQCTESGSCQSASGDLQVSGFPGGTGISRGYAQALDPSQDQPRFPGTFADSKEQLLISSGFTEIDFRNASGNRVRSFSEPLSVRFQARSTSWGTLQDLMAGTNRIEVPMYSFDDVTAQWVSEANGELQDASGMAIPESALGAIQAGTYSKPVFIAFTTNHLSSWNCDRPVESHTCLKGRLVDSVSGSALVGVEATVSGVSYTGNSQSMTTGLDGYFVGDMMRSELAGEDVDKNGKTGETFQAHLIVNGTAGIYTGAPFATPTLQRLITSYSSPTCTPAACDCPDLGDIAVEFELPRLCEVTVAAKFSGEDLTGNADSPLMANAAIANAEVRGELSGEVQVSASASAAICAGKQCNAGTADAQGNVTFNVPVIGPSPRLSITASLKIDQNGSLHYYYGNLVVDGCAQAQARVASTVEVGASHASLTSLNSYIATLGAGSSKSTLKQQLAGCGCRIGQPVSGKSGAAFGIASLGLLGGLRYRRRRRAL